MGRQRGRPTTPSQFRLSAELLRALDDIARHETEKTAAEYSRTDAVRIAIKEAARSRGIVVGESREMPAGTDRKPSRKK